MGVSLGTAFTMWSLAQPQCSWAPCQDGEGAGLLLLHKQMQYGGAPGTGKGTCGIRQALRNTCNTLHTCSIPVPRDRQHCRVYTRVCTKHTTLQCTYVAPTYK